MITALAAAEHLRARAARWEQRAKKVAAWDLSRAARYQAIAREIRDTADGLDGRS